MKSSRYLRAFNPQEIALNDARKATSMFTKPELQAPLLGVIENMSWFTPEQHPDEKYYIFGKGGGHKLALEYDTWLLGQIPLVMEVGEAAEKGLSVFSQTSRQVAEAFEKISELIISKTQDINDPVPQLKT